MKRFLLLLVLFMSLAQIAYAQVIDSVWSPPYICQAHEFDVEVFGMRADGSIHNGPESYHISNDTIYANFYFVPGIGPAIPTPFQRQLTIPAPPLGHYKIKVQSFYNGNPLLAHFTAISICGGVAGLAKRTGQDWQPLIFPNPAADQVSILLPPALKLISAQVSDLSGKTWVAVSGKTEALLQLDIHNLPPGIYLVKLNTAHGIITRKVVKI